jgi:hypothetical protein
MRVKIGDQWHSATATQPIMIELSERDRANLAAMPSDYHYYACFADADPRQSQERIAWMRDGAIYEAAEAEP